MVNVRIEDLIRRLVDPQPNLHPLDVEPSLDVLKYGKDAAGGLQEIEGTMRGIKGEGGAPDLNVDQAMRNLRMRMLIEDPFNIKSKDKYPLAAPPIKTDIG